MQSVHILALLDFKEECSKTGHISGGGYNVYITQLVRKLKLETRRANLCVVIVNMIICLFKTLISPREISMK